MVVSINLEFNKSEWTISKRKVFKEECQKQ